MKLVALNTLFQINYGNSFDLNILQVCSPDSPDKINYISRTRENNGVSAIVQPIVDAEPFDEGLITVAGSGNSVLESFIQPAPFYTGYHVFILCPLEPMSTIEKLFYCYCIRKNQYKYSFGRQANKTLKELLVPIKMPSEFASLDIKDFVPPQKESVVAQNIKLDVQKWEWFDLTSLFDVTSSRDDLVSNYSKGKASPYISSSEFNNGITSYVDAVPTNKGNTITANRGGSVGHFFYQKDDFIVTPVDVRILSPRFKLNKYIGLFLITVLKLEKKKYNFSRKMGTEKLKKMKIKLPSKGKEPDWKFMEKYIKSLPYSSSI